MTKDFISHRLILYLIIIFLISLILYYKISTSPRIEDLFISLAATVLGIIITLYLVDRSIRKAEEKEWAEFEEIISIQIIEILFSLCNVLNISSNLWKHFLEIFSKDIAQKEKVIEYINFYESQEINLDYIKEIVTDDHLIDFFSNGYKDVHQRVDNLYRLYNIKLTAEQSAQIVNLRIKILKLINNMNTFRMLNIAVKEFNANLEEGFMNDFRENISNTIFIVKNLVRTV
jgi:hypothetical protein